MERGGGAADLYRRCRERVQHVLVVSVEICCSLLPLPTLWRRPEPMRQALCARASVPAAAAGIAYIRSYLLKSIVLFLFFQPSGTGPEPERRPVCARASVPAATAGIGYCGSYVS